VSVILRSKKIKSQNRKHGKHVQAKSAECKMIAEIGGKKKQERQQQQLGQHATDVRMWVCVWGVMGLTG